MMLGVMLKIVRVRKEGGRVINPGVPCLVNIWELRISAKRDIEG